jgi:hypothetical protein
LLVDGRIRIREALKLKILRIQIHNTAKKSGAGSATLVIASKDVVFMPVSL